MMDEVSNKYIETIRGSGTEELVGVLGQIDKERFPNRHDFVKSEIESRSKAGLISSVGVKKADWRRRATIISVVVVVVIAYLSYLLMSAKPNSEEIGRLRSQLASSEQLMSEIGKFDVLPDEPQFRNLSVSLMGHPDEGTILFKIKTKDQEGLVSVDWTRNGDDVTITGIHY